MSTVVFIHLLEVASLPCTPAYDLSCVVCILPNCVLWAMERYCTGSDNPIQVNGILDSAVFVWFDIMCS